MMDRTGRIGRCLLATAAALLGAAFTSAASGQVVISQVYGGGGNGGSTFTHDFIELFNRGSAAVNIGGWSVQYASAAGAFSGAITAKTDIPAGTVLQPGQYYLIQQAQGAGGSAPLPTPDLVTDALAETNRPIAMSGTAGKVLLNSTTTAITGGGTGACAALFANPSLVDLATYGAASCFEGATPGPAASNPNSIIRGNGGCVDSNNNGSDFTAVPAAPRNSASPLNVCQASTPPSGTGSSTPAQVCRNQSVVLSMAVLQGAAPASPITSVIGDTSQIGGTPGVTFLDDGIAPDVTAGDAIYTAQATVGASAFFVAHSVPVQITDALGRIGTSSVPVSVINCDPRGTLVATPNGICPNGPANFTMTLIPGVNPPSTGVQVLMDLSPLGLSGSQSMFDDGTEGDAVAGDGTYSYRATVTDLPTGPYTVGGVIIDEQGRVGALSANITIVPCTPSPATVVISQVYGGGGNAGATLTHDYVELFNRTNVTADLNGLSLQYASNNGAFNVAVALTGTIEPGRYFLVQLSRGAGGTQALPTPDMTTPDSGAGTITVGSTAGRVALVHGLDPIGTDCLVVSNIIDLVGYGSGTTCVEGLAPAPGTSNTTAAIRLSGGCQDFGQNVADIIIGAPQPRNSSTPVNDCNGGSTCPQDVNGDGNVDPDDLADYIACYFAVPPCDFGDFSGDGTVDPDDLADYIAAYFGPPC